MTEPNLLIRLADNGDDDFILALVPRFVDFPLPRWRQRHECIKGIGDDLLAHLENPPANSYLFVAENADGERVGFIRLQRTEDFFTGHRNCHIADLAVAPAHERQGIGSALLGHAQKWAHEQHCHLITLAVFPDNMRARALYEACGYAPDLLRLAKPVR